MVQTEFIFTSVEGKEVVPPRLVEVANCQSSPLLLRVTNLTNLAPEVESEDLGDIVCLIGAPVVSENCIHVSIFEPVEIICARRVLDLFLLLNHLI